MGSEPVVIPEVPVKEQIRMQKRSVEKSKRTLEREKKKLEREKKKALTEIRKLAEKGQTAGAKMMAKDIVRLSNQIKKLEQFCGQLGAVALRIGMCTSLNEMGDAMNACASAMSLVSSKLDAQKLAQMSKELVKQDMLMEMKSDMLSDIMDSLDDGLEEDTDELYEQVLAEAGVKAMGELPGTKNQAVPNLEGDNKMTDSQVSGAVDDLDKMLDDLKK